MAADPFSILLLVILVLLVGGLVVRKLKGGLSGNTVLLIGLSSSGKTSLISKLLNAKSEPLTTISTVSNVGAYEAEEKKKIQLVDIPGNERVRGLEIEKFKHSARGIIFVINSLAVAKEIRDVAELIFSTLTDKTINSRRPKILIAANHQDGQLAKAGTAIVNLLEKELDLVRKTQSAQLKDINDGEKTQVYLGDKKQTKFSFSQLKNDFEVHECSAKEGQIDAIHSWLFSCAS